MSVSCAVACVRHGRPYGRAFPGRAAARGCCHQLADPGPYRCVLFFAHIPPAMFFFFISPVLISASLCRHMQITKLSNGVVVASNDNGSPASSVSVVVAAGSRYETAGNQGAAQLLAHSAFQVRCTTPTPSSSPCCNRRSRISRSFVFFPHFFLSHHLICLPFPPSSVLRAPPRARRCA